MNITLRMVQEKPFKEPKEKKHTIKECKCEPNYRNPICCEHGDTCNLS